MWKPAPENFKLEAHEIHIWRANLEISPEQVNYLQTLLSEAEFNRAARFKFPQLQQRFIAAKGTLRILLSKYLGCSPKTVVFSYGSHGKPELVSKIFRSEPLYFNQSDTNLFALYAFTKINPVGVDIEWIRNDIEALSLAERFFAPNETIALQSQPPEQQITAFFRIWTRKEAFIKAIGEGLSFPLHDFEVNLDKNFAKLKSIHADTLKATKWTLEDLQPSEDYIGAVAVEGRVDKIELYRL